ncbi:MAG TPA: ATP-grasp domain-containing protein, partial [Gemmataceae bacterium]|nr:ATP-grasp domain-containing protein [Gemmataceae bacterium]
AGIVCPAVVASQQSPARDRRWLLKPRAGAGGAGIRIWDEHSVPRVTARYYLQEYIDEDSYSALYLGDSQHVRLLGVTRQLIGLDWLHASPFHYCGSIGPCILGPALQPQLHRIGEVLTNGAGLRGLFGVDYVLAGEEPWPVEVNPRYTASVEILEHALGVCALALHGRVFDPSLHPRSETTPVRVKVLGKAILFARDDLVVPADAPWRVQGCEKVPSFADIPAVGQTIARGRPVLTLFAAADSMTACEEALRQTARDLDRCLFGR